MTLKPTPNTTTTRTPQPLTLPPHIFAKLSPHAYLAAHLDSPNGSLRPSGRTPSQSRPPTIHTNALTHAHGSAVIRCGDTAVVCGVRGEILKVDDIAGWTPREGLEPLRDGTDDGVKRRKKDSEELAQLGLLVPNLELATGCSPAHLPGGPPSPLAQALSQRVLTLLHTSNIIDLEQLRIWHRPPSPADVSMEGQELVLEAEVKAFWVLYMDVWFISLDGNAFDAAWLALLAAVRNTRLPRAWWDGEREGVLCDERLSESQRLRVRDFPVPLSFGVFTMPGGGKGGLGMGEKGKTGDEKWILADMDGFEEALCLEIITVVVGEGDRVVKIEKSGGGAVRGGELRGLVRLARERREVWVGVLEGG